MKNPNHVTDTSTPFQPPGRHQEQAPKQRCTFSSTTFSSVQFSSVQQQRSTMAGKEVLMNTSSVFKPTPTVQTDEPEKGKDLHEGGRVELTGLSSEDLNGQRGTINDRYIPDRKRWPLVVDKTRRKLSCKPANLMVLASCGQCGAEKAVEELKKCSKCHAVHYCNDECQRTTPSGHQYFEVCPPIFCFVG